MTKRFELFCSSISAIYKYIQKIERAETAKYGLKGSHVQCLITMSHHRDGLTAAELSERCEKDKAAISRTVSELEEKGLLLRERAYRAPLKLTQRGLEIAVQLEAAADKAVAFAGRGLTDEKREIFYESRTSSPQIFKL